MRANVIHEKTILYKITVITMDAEALDVELSDPRPDGTHCLLDQHTGKGTTAANHRMQGRTLATGSSATITIMATLRSQGNRQHRHSLFRFRYRPGNVFSCVSCQTILSWSKTIVT
jgi:hypothetical protein